MKKEKEKPDPNDEDNKFLKEWYWSMENILNAKTMTKEELLKKKAKDLSKE